MKVGSHLEGRSVAPLLDDPGREWKEAAFSQFSKGKTRGYAMRTEEYRYVEWVKGDEVVARELYDQMEDPEERVNLVREGDRSEVVEGLSVKLNRGKGWKDVLPK